MKKAKKTLAIFLIGCFVMLSNCDNCFALTDDIVSGIGRNAYLTGHYEPSNYPEYFTVVPKEYSYRQIYLRKDVLDAFLKMANAAKADRIQPIIILSGLRNYEYQKGIWNNKYNAGLVRGKKPHENFATVLRLSAVPGLSRHHWGADIDVISLSNNYSSSKSMAMQHAWLQKNAERYGFFLVYTPNRTGGHETEMWHYTYKPVSAEILPMTTGLKISDIAGFQGEENISNFRSFMKKYMFNINTKLLTPQRQSSKSKS